MALPPGHAGKRPAHRALLCPSQRPPHAQPGRRPHAPDGPVRQRPAQSAAGAQTTHFFNHSFLYAHEVRRRGRIHHHPEGKR